MNISVVGLGYVGLSAAACFSKMGNRVFGIDKKNKIELLKSQNIDIYEEGLDIIIKEISDKKLISYHEDFSCILNTEIIMIAVGTPFIEKDNSTNLNDLIDCVTNIATTLIGAEDYKVIIIRSTIPIGTSKKIESLIKQINPNLSFDLVFIPEFVREGKIIYDFFNPSRIVIGSSNDKPIKKVNDLYSEFIRKNVPILYTTLESAECIKYATNSFLGVKISFINQMANLCEHVGADIDDVSKGIGLDPRIGSEFLRAGIGFGGSCFPKDMSEIISFADKIDSPLSIIKESFLFNKNRVNYLSNKILSDFPEIKKIAVLGLAFKENTDDIRYSPSIFFIKNMLKNDIEVLAYDPKAIEKSKNELSSPLLTYANSAEDACQGVDAIFILTEWSEFANLDFLKLGSVVKQKLIIDLRNILNKKLIESYGFKYRGVGKNY